jgi:hypothetical protein
MVQQQVTKQSEKGSGPPTVRPGWLSQRHLVVAGLSKVARRRSVQVILGTFSRIRLPASPHSTREPMDAKKWRQE